ncbi:hypothetical protein [Larkinella terrae]|uniref:Uncharacterized protein n=1 Tax=Larkinella terrae TaxID=2025311 RepID=A0A7K0EII6_9BACT|nr:hypothetical protein [Larkinella terrae]MRS61660.1 hypothetical protein [Larkinella terrae]
MMIPDELNTIILFPGFNEVTLPKDAELIDIRIEGYQVNMLFKTKGEPASVNRQFYAAFNSAPTDYTQGILRLLKKIEFSDGTSMAMIYEVYPYEGSQ